MDLTSKKVVNERRIRVVIVTVLSNCPDADADPFVRTREQI